MISGALNRIAPPIIVLALCLGLGLGLARISWSIYALWGFKPPPAPALALGPSHPVSDFNLAATLARANLFGAGISQPVATPPSSIPPSPLDIVIKGLLTAFDTRHSAAILAVNGQTARVFQPGEALTRDSQLAQVLPHGVLVSQQGKLAMVALPRAKLDRLMTPGVAANVQQLQTQLLQEPSRLQQHVQFQPVMQQSRLQGYRVQPGPDATLFKQVGLQPGDVILSVNGVMMADLASRMAVIQHLQQASQITLEIQRHGQQQQLTLEFNP